MVRLGRWKGGEVGKVGNMGGWWGGKGERLLVSLMLIKAIKRQDGIATEIACTILGDCSWEVQIWKNGVTIKGRNSL